ncbi:hypothetical protein [Salinarimonas ramus]|uniref:Uncharacterized protein n=1 Tax=Salinarimonas ramus TaxID=690164 RepID=A0A917Q6E3_9HYPH|nr:hypothetical protein [Salinarimonas ramus]GGK29855.1 hypothetical protein GCM10011322_15390 [Salinarimonas ramus]
MRDEIVHRGAIHAVRKLALSIGPYARYYLLKRHARELVAEDINERIQAAGARANWRGMQLATIDDDAIEFARLEWVRYYGEGTHSGFPHSWETLLKKHRARPSFFDLAVWQIVDGRRVLQALALGKPSNAKTHLSLNWVERSFAPTYLRGALVPILACAEEYAKLLGSYRVVIKDPVDPGKYQRYGYAPFRIKGAKGNYLSKEL